MSYLDQFEGFIIPQTKKECYLYLKKTRLVKSDVNVLQAGVAMFNILPKNIKEKRLDKRIKHLLKGFQVECCPYSVKEFREYVRVERRTDKGP